MGVPKSNQFQKKLNSGLTSAQYLGGKFHTDLKSFWKGSDYVESVFTLQTLPLNVKFAYGPLVLKINIKVILNFHRKAVTILLWNHGLFSMYDESLL
jgi:hypothetical protein